MKSWFDQQTGMLNLDEAVANSATFQKIMADQIVTDAELSEQADLVVSLLKKVDETLAPEQKALVQSTLTELAVLFAVNQHAEMQSTF